MIPSQIKYDPNATPPQFTDNEDYRIEPGTHIRVKIMGTRSEVGEMWAIGTINEDYLGYVHVHTLICLVSSCFYFCDLLFDVIISLLTPYFPQPAGTMIEVLHRLPCCDPSTTLEVMGRSGVGAIMRQQLPSLCV